MRKTICASVLGIAVLSFGSEAFAQANVHNADVLRPGDNMLYGEIGWPDFTMGFQHGMTRAVDIGVAFSIIYGFEYTTIAPVPGLGIRVPIRITPFRSDKFSFQLHFSPGFKFDEFGSANCVTNLAGQTVCGGGGLGGFAGNGVLFGLWLDFGLDAGIHLTREATLTFGMEAPFYVNFTGGVYGGLPLLFGPGFEYDINEHIGVGINTKFGVSILAFSVPGNGLTGGGTVTGTGFGFLVQPFFGYRL